MKPKATISWSGGKDSAFALYKILFDDEYDVVGIHTLIDAETGRVGLHGVREHIIEAQTESLALPLTSLYTSMHTGRSNYEDVLRTFYRRCEANGIDFVVFGDIFLEDLRAYREALLRDFHIKPVFPLWRIPSRTLYDDFVDAGFKAAICSANARLLSKQLLGKTLDKSTPEKFKTGIDVCGENGEYHTIVYDGPVFGKPLALQGGEVVKKWYDYKVRTSGENIEIVRTPYWFQEFFLLDG